jgi:hypothetical protein
MAACNGLFSCSVSLPNSTGTAKKEGSTTATGGSTCATSCEGLVKIVGTTAESAGSGCSATCNGLAKAPLSAADNQKSRQRPAPDGPLPKRRNGDPTGWR